MEEITIMTLEDMTLDVEQNIEVEGSIEDVFKSVLKRLGEGNMRPDGESMNMQLEEWAGGRWFRDRGEGIQHLWGHVQVIKPPVLLELSGPMFMSYPALNHLEVKLDETDGGTKVTLRHRAVGMIDPQHREGVTHGWDALLDAIKSDFSKTSGSPA
jgi:hypothetical protein